MNISRIIRQDKEFSAFLECLRHEMRKDAPLPIVVNGIAGGAADAFITECVRENSDMNVNVCKKKQLTNMRASGSDDAIRLITPRVFSLEQCLEFLADDELLECTPKSLRIRKRELDHSIRMRELMKKRAQNEK